MPTDAVVIGGGLVGLSCALNLQLNGLRTIVVDPETTRRSASWGNAGHLATEQVEPLASSKTVRSFPRRLFFRGGALSLPPRDLDTWLPFALRFVRSSAPDRFAAGKTALRSLLQDAIPAWHELREVQARNISSPKKDTSSSGKRRPELRPAAHRGAVRTLGPQVSAMPRLRKSQRSRRRYRVRSPARSASRAPDRFSISVSLPSA
jgi:glycine/D-amino acid oxidase-like deaminating enzyme